MQLTRRTFLMASAAPALAQRKAAPRPPNIVLVLADGLGAWLLACYGNREIRTPNIDLLARSGTRFLHNNVSAPVSSAARATLFTGRAASQHGIRDTLLPNAALPASFRGEVMISDVMASAGYNCGYAGKWDMGGDAVSQHGFRTWDASRAAAEQVTAKAAQFLAGQKAEQPFFLAAAYSDPVEPYDSYPRKFYEMYSRATFETVGWRPASPSGAQGKEYFRDVVGNLRKYAAAISALDEQVGSLMAALDKTGLRDQTLVVFTAATGSLAGRHGLWGAGHASAPVNFYQEAIEAPMVWNWPGHTPVEAVRPEVVSHYDLLPSLCEAAGLKPPGGRSLCGRSYALLALNKPLPKKEPWRNLAFGQLGNAEMVMDYRYKLVLRNNGGGPNELYDLREVPSESTNQYQNPKFVSVRDVLSKELDRWRRTYGTAP